jgi:hypothetical protein
MHLKLKRNKLILRRLENQIKKYMKNNRFGLCGLLVTYCIILLLISCSQGTSDIAGPTLGKYKNEQDLYLYIYANKSYKAIMPDTTFQGHWEFIAPNEIGFTNWKDEHRGNLDYKFAILKPNTIIFDLDNESNNYFLIR